MSEKKVRETQCDLLLHWWDLGYEWISPKEALELGIMRLAARIFDLRSKPSAMFDTIDTAALWICPRRPKSFANGPSLEIR